MRCVWNFIVKNYWRIGSTETGKYGRAVHKGLLGNYTTPEPSPIEANLETIAAGCTVW